jgi:hypothetical protein
MILNVGKVGLYLVNGTAGNVGLPGAPILQFSLLVNTTNGAVTGQAQLTQSIQGPLGDIHISHLTGQVRHTGFGEFTKIVALQGDALISFPPPAIGHYLAPFSAHFAVEDAWSGVGGWTLGETHIENVPVKADET